MNERWLGFYATRVDLPLFWMHRRWRLLQRFVGNPHYFAQATRLPEISWKECVRTTRAPRLLEPEMGNGNVRLAELGILAAFARDCADGTNLFEIGTFDGRTSLNFAFNAPVGCTVYTLDIPAEEQPKFCLAKGERHMIRKRRLGARWEAHWASQPGVVPKIRQLWGDSATFDYSAYQNSCSLVFVDGSHAYEYAISDSRAATELAMAGGTIIWHDYGVWKGVTKALEELREVEGQDLWNIRGTSLVVSRKPGAAI